MKSLKLTNLKVGQSDITTEQTINSIRGTSDEPINFANLYEYEWYILSGNYIGENGLIGHISSEWLVKKQNSTTLLAIEGKSYYIWKYNTVTTYWTQTQISLPQTSGSSGQILQSLGAYTPPIWKDQVLPLITGTESSPINLATDIEDGYSLIQGYVFVTSTLSNQFNTKSLIYKITNSDDSCYVYSYNDSNLVVSNSLLKVASNGTIDLTQTKIISAIGKINGIDQVIPTPTDIYVPTESGTEGQVLKSQGEGKEPIWVTVAEEQSYAPYIEITPATATNGTFEDSDFTNLTEHNEVYIILNNEIYRKADLENIPGIISYTHNGWNGNQTLDKSINITVSTKAWTLKIGSPDEKPIQNSANTVSSGGVYSALQDLGSYEDVLDLSSDNVTKTASIMKIGHIVKQMTTFTVTGNSEKT